MSSFACSPQWGSEPGVGWRWLLEIVKHHDVVLVTHAYFRGHLQAVLQESSQTLEVLYVDAWALGAHPHRQLNSRLYYVWWQWHARAAVRKRLAEQHFDVIHHLTWGTLRFPCFLGGLGVPLVMGPLGGAEAAPLRLLRGLPWRIVAFDVLRSVSLMWVRFDPLATWGPKRSALVLCKSEDSRSAMPRSVLPRTVVLPEIGSLEVNARQHEAAEVNEGKPQRLRLLFAGRLLGWKGVAIALGAVEHLLDKGLDVQFDIAGDGPLRGYLRRRIDHRGNSNRIRLLGSLPRPELMALYARSDLFLFPSLHDSSGNVVLEALSHGLPVVCLDLGGPQLYIDASCGVVVPSRGRSRAQLELELSEQLACLLADRIRLSALSRAAVAHARRQTWSATVNKAYGVIGQRLGWTT